ncbi:Ctr copper transporter family-domain-containing protein [Melanogaster broomeanus]|nr:Ctr copper transporter family-domain-containing protein [Melanogaster broomeanus]
MTPWLHVGGADFLLFKTWQPSSHGAIAGACIGLLLFSILERCLAAYRRAQELHWKARSVRLVGDCFTFLLTASDSERLAYPRNIPPFIPSHDIPRGMIQAVQSAFSFTLMLAVMTFNAAYIISIILGLGIGEILFGRIGRVSGCGNGIMARADDTFANQALTPPDFISLNLSKPSQ